MIFGTHVDLAALSMGGSSLIDVLASLVSTDERYSLNIGVFADLGNGIATTLHNIDDAIRDTRLLEQVNEELSGASNTLRGFEHVSVTECDAERVHPEGDHGREVVRSDTSHDTEWDTVRVDIDASSDALGRLTLSERGEAAGVLDDLITAENITSCISKRLAVLLGNERSELILVLLKQLLVLEHVADTCRDRRLRPGLERIFGVCHSFVELTLGREGHLSDDILCERTFHIEALGSLRVDPLAVDEVFVLKEEKMLA